MVVLAISKLMRPSNLERKKPMIDKFSDMRICTVFHQINLGELVTRCWIVRI